MKTSELKKIVEENGYKVINEENNVSIFIYEQEAKMGDWIAYVNKKTLSNFETYPGCPKVIAQAILDYAYTSLEEREEETKYYLKLNKSFNDTSDGRYVNFNTINEKYNFNNKFELHSVKTQFTQKEIDEMPFDTKFFEKVEVK